jgi:predicted DNA-binding transcriptional regulator AlpA
MTHLEEPLLSDAEVASELGVARLTLAQWRTKGRGPDYIQVGRLIRYTPSALRKYLGSRVVQPEGAT